MIKDRNIFIVAVFILIIQYFLGLPTFWKNILLTMCSLALIFFSVKISLPKKSVKHKTRRERSTPVFVESAPIYPKDNTVESAGSVEAENNQSAQ